MGDSKANFEPGAEQLYKEELRKSDEDKQADDTARPMQVEGNETDAYIGVDPIYQNYSNDTEKPYAPGNDAEQAIVEEFVAVQDAALAPASVGEGEEATPATPAAEMKVPPKATPPTPPASSQS